MQLSEHFSLAEFTVSERAARLGLDNTPPPQILTRLQTVTAPQMERVRLRLGGFPIRATSVYRAPAVNLAVGGAKASAHVEGWAVDFVCPGFGSPLEICNRLATSGITFDQLIHEHGTWVHISFDPRRRGEILTIDATGTRPGLHPVRRS